LQPLQSFQLLLSAQDCERTSENGWND
jgi:hypothetical protein